MIETERKFLVVNDGFLTQATQQTPIAQGYLNTHPGRTVRVRISGEDAFLTVKGKSNDTGLSRFEWETQIDLRAAKNLLELCEPGAIRKTRYIVPSGPHFYEVDVFEAENHGLIIAEIELESEDEPFEKPDWLGPEVSGQPRYYNANLIKTPYRLWHE